MGRCRDILLHELRGNNQEGDRGRKEERGGEVGERRKKGWKVRREKENEGGRGRLTNEGENGREGGRK